MITTFTRFIKSTILIFALLIGSIQLIYGQNWTPYNPVNICNYSSSNLFADVAVIKTDSSVFSTTDSVYFLNTIVTMVNNQPIITPQFLQKKNDQFQ